MLCLTFRSIYRFRLYSLRSIRQTSAGILPISGPKLSLPLRVTPRYLQDQWNAQIFFNWNWFPSTRGEGFSLTGVNAWRPSIIQEITFAKKPLTLFSNECKLFTLSPLSLLSAYAKKAQSLPTKPTRSFMKRYYYEVKYNAIIFYVIVLNDYKASIIRKSNYIYNLCPPNFFWMSISYCFLRSSLGALVIC